jgi:hypothetical protein
MDLFGGAKNTKKTKKTKKTMKTTKDSTKSKKSTKTRSKAKGGNFLGAVGDLVAPTGWGPFATAAGLLALDRADAALRRGTKEKKEKMKGGKKMKGGNCDSMSNKIHESLVTVKRPDALNNKNDLQKFNTLKGNVHTNPKYILRDNDFLGKITCDGNSFYVNIEIYCGEPTSIVNYKLNQAFNSFVEAKNWLIQRKNQIALINLALLQNHETCKNPRFISAYNLRRTPPPPNS